MSDLIVNMLFELVIPATIIAGVLASLIGSAFFLNALITRVMSPAVYKLTREADRSQAEQVSAFLYAPLFSGGAAVMGGVGVNYLTEADRATQSPWDFGCFPLAAMSSSV